MISKEKLFKSHHYLLSKYQAELYRQLRSYMDSHDLTQKQVAKRLGVSTSYINQVLKGNFNFTLKKLIELSLLIGKVPNIEFLSIEQYLMREENNKVSRLVAQSTATSPVVYVKVPTIETSMIDSMLSDEFDESITAAGEMWVPQSFN